MSSQTLSTQLQHIAAQATADPDFVFHNIVYRIDETLLWEAFQRLRTGKKKAPGIDGQTATEYAKDLLDNLRDVHEHLKTGRYRATPIKRTWIPKEDGSQRPIGILILEDKIVQKAVALLLEAVFEGTFTSVPTVFDRSATPITPCTWSVS